MRSCGTAALQHIGSSPIPASLFGHQSVSTTARGALDCACVPTPQAHSTHAEEVAELQAQLQQALAINKCVAGLPPLQPSCLACHVRVMYVSCTYATYAVCHEAPQFYNAAFAPAQSSAAIAACAS